MDYEANKKLRRSNRERRKEERGRDEEGRRMGFASGEDGGVKLLPRSREDDVKARMAMARSRNKRGHDGVNAASAAGHNHSVTLTTYPPIQHTHL